MRIVFMGTPDFAVPSLANLIEKGHEVRAVVTQPDRPKGRGRKLCPSPVKKYAIKKGVDVYQPVKVKTSEFRDMIKGFNPEAIVVAAYGRILTEGVLEIPKHGCINVHASLLPKYRGAAPINMAIINGECITGVTTMLMDKGMDTGDIFQKKEVKITNSMTAGQLHDILSTLGAKLVCETLQGIEDGSLKPVRQCNDEATYAPMMTRETGKIDWNKMPEDIHNLVRGTNPWPAAYTFYKNERMKVWKAEVCTDIVILKDVFPGTILDVAGDGIKVACDKGAVLLSEIQMDSCRRMSVEECWHNLDEGEVLG